MQFETHVHRSLLSQVIAGTVTAVSVMYIVPLTPAFMQGSGFTAQESSTLAALLCAVSTLLYALLVPKPPGVMIPGIVPLSLFGAFAANHIPWTHILGIAVCSSAVFALMSVSGLVTRAAAATPFRLKCVVKLAIGYYLIAAAARTAGLLGGGSVLLGLKLTSQSALFLLGTAVLFAVWEFKRSRPIAILIGISVAMVGGLLLGDAELPDKIFAAPELRWISPDISSALRFEYLDEMLTLLAVLIADVVSTFEAKVSPAPDLQEADGSPVHLTRGLTASGAIGAIGPVFGTGTIIVAFEGITGILAGGRTRVCTLVTGLLFVIMVFTAPVTSAVPAFASAVALAFVGYNIAKYPYCDLERDRITRYLELVALAGILCSSIAVALFGCIAAYPLFLWRKGGEERPRAADWIAAAVSLVLLTMVLIEQIS
ncbi:MAG: hypothetical protein KDD66_04180 [Bdellovibrionales bacterium]|nr:hypothetical protein [Bdellovibrionales bacterium]